MKDFRFIAALAMAGMMTVCSQGAKTVDRDTLYQSFQNPPVEAKPFVRWWWNGLRVRKNEIFRELDIMQQAGIGGFEINPIAQPEGSTALDDPSLTWLSPAWTRMVKATVDEARRRGMVPDIIVGSGWPFGAEFLRPDQMTQRLETSSFIVKGPVLFTATQKELLDRVRFSRNRAWENAPAPQLMFVVLAPEKPDALSACRDVTGSKSKGIYHIRVPAGPHRIHLGVLRCGFSQVVHGAPGAKGPVLDHYNADAVNSYLNKMSDALDPIFDGKFGGPIRAVFCDSIELSGANWTGDIEKEFEKRAGYPLRPWLPFVVNFDNPPPVGGKLADEVRRVRYDWSKVLVSLFRERFIRPYAAWCRAHGALARYQAYGSPWLLGMLEGYMEADIPESNNWFYSPNFRTQGFRVWGKYAASAAHLTGKNVASSESMTNTRGVFRATLEQIKTASDFNFIIGLDHDVLHGFNYSPPEAGFPGWVRYGTYFSEQNTWWPVFPKWSAYDARLAAVFQGTEPVAPVAVMAPRADIWSRDGLTREPFHTEPWYAHRLWESLSNNGMASDHITETILQGATYEDGRLHYGPAAYKAVILCGVQSLEPASANALQQFVRAGGRVAFVGGTPNRSPGYLNAAAHDRAVRDAVDALRQTGGGRVLKLPAPNSEGDFPAWAGHLLDGLAVVPTARLTHPDPDVFMTQRRAADHDLFFLANTADKRKICPIAFTETGTPWRWNPESGERQPFPVAEAVTLDPYESMLLVFDRNRPAPAEAECPASIPATGGTILDRPWTATFDPVAGKPFSLEIERLEDLGRSSDPRLRAFAGTVTYRTKFTSDKTPEWIDLGAVHDISEVTLNGKNLGTRWYGRHAYPVGKACRSGENRLSVRVTTVLFNYARTLRDNKMALRWTRGQAKNPAPAGLAGPVRLVFP